MVSIISIPDTVEAARFPLSRIITRVVFTRLAEIILDSHTFPARDASPTAVSSGE